MLRSGPTDILRFYNSISAGKTYLGQGWRGALQREYRVDKEKADTHKRMGLAMGTYTEELDPSGPQRPFKGHTFLHCFVHVLWPPL